MGWRSEPKHAKGTSHAVRCGLLLQPSAFGNMARKNVTYKGVMKNGKGKMTYGSNAKLLAAGAMEFIAARLIEDAQTNCIANKRSTTTNHDVCTARDFDLNLSATFCNSAIASCRNVPVVGEVCLVESESKERKERMRKSKENREERMKKAKSAKAIN